MTKENNLNYETIIKFIQESFILNTMKNLKQDFNYVNVIFDSNINNTFNISALTETKESLAHCILSENIHDKISIYYNFKPFITTLYKKPYKNVFNQVIQTLEEITRHECYHVKQFLWLKQNTHNWIKTLYELKFYMLRTIYEEREFEIEAKKIEFNKVNEIKPFNQYLSQFLF